MCAARIRTYIKLTYLYRLPQFCQSQTCFRAYAGQVGWQLAYTKHSVAWKDTSSNCHNYSIQEINILLTTDGNVCWRGKR